jgi:ADP-ribosyl-[dinitrogen reductase] hydrolase
MRNKELLTKVQGSLMGVCIGDAMGMPVEIWEHDKIMALNDGHGITDFISPLQKRIWDTAELKAGDTTDDWQLTRAVATSIIRTKGLFDIVDCAEEHVRALDLSLFGWGKTTQNAIEAIKRGERIPGRDPLPPTEPGKGCGNGVVMKVTPLPLSDFVLGASNGSLWHDIHQLGSITHPDIRASIAAYPVALMIQCGLHPQKIESTDEGLRLLEKVIPHVKKTEKQYGVTTELVSDHLSLIIDNTESADALRNAVGCGFHATQTAAFSIGTFLRHPTDFRAGILEAVNAGGDTDTNASVVGALIGANCGLDAIPKEWQEFNPAYQEALELGKQLCNL